MRLRITSGALGGRILTINAPADDFRPTVERTRQALINKIRSRLPDARVVDVCAGSGIAGLEMLSNGAAHADFVEQDPVRAGLIADQCRLLGVAGSARVIERGVDEFIDSLTTRYDIIFYDPPYADQGLALLTPRLAQALEPDGLLIYERARQRGAGQPPTASPEGWVVKTREYGDTTVEFWERAGVAAS